MLGQHRHLGAPHSLATDDELGRLNHELRTALSIVLLTTEALQLEIFGPLTLPQQEALGKLYEHTTQVQALIETFLQLADTTESETLVS